MNILLTGANGYVGKRLKEELLKDKSVRLRLLERSALSQKDERCESVVGNTFDLESLRRALDGIDTAYYLIHSLASGINFRELDKQSAQNFLDIAIECGVKRIIYLGGLGVKEHASEHLLSRIETGEILSSQPDKIQTIWFRAGVIIGSGSASFEIIRHLIQKLPIMIAPRWVSTKAQPIGINDVIRYLNEGRSLQTDGSLIVDIGSDVMSYGEMMVKMGEIMGLKRYIIPVPLLTPNLSSYWVTLFTPVQFSIIKSLIEGLDSEVVAQNENAKLFSFKPQNYETAVNSALQEIESNQVISRWADSYGNLSWEKLHKSSPADAIYIERHKASIANLDKHTVFESFMKVGGKEGWFSYDFLWEVRGLIDKLLGGVGLNRGRRDACDLRVGDCLDFWRVIDVQEDRRLLLFAQMKLPGKAWLEFMIENDELIVSAYFLPSRFLGRLYWFVLIPLHGIIFKDMASSIIEKSRAQKLG